MNRRLTRARRASAAIVSGSPVPRVVSSAASTRRALSAESSRRRTASRLVLSATAGSGTGGHFDGGEEHRRVLADHAGQLGGEGHRELRPLRADGGDGRFEGGAVVVVEAGEDLVAGPQQPAHGVDLLVGGGGVAAGPVGEGRDGGGEAFPVGGPLGGGGPPLRGGGGVGGGGGRGGGVGAGRVGGGRDGGGEAFPVGEQLGEVAPQLGGVGGIGAEVVRGWTAASPPGRREAAGKGGTAARPPVPPARPGPQSSRP